MFINALTYLPFFINILKAFDFPLPANAETVSQPVNACSPIRDLIKSCRLVPDGKSVAIWSLTDLIFIILLLEPLPAFMYAASNVLLWLRMRTRTSVLSAWIMHGPWTCFAWRIIRVSASSWLVCNSGTASIPVDPNFQHSSPRVTNSNLLSNLDVNSVFFPLWYDKLYNFCFVWRYRQNLLQDFTWKFGNTFFNLTPSCLELR